jgi:hypothetical protein
MQLFTSLKSAKILQFFLLFVAVLAVGYYLFCWYMGDTQAISWQVLSQLQQQPLALQSFEVAGQHYQIPAKVMYVTEQYVPSLMQLHHGPNYIFLGMFVIAISALWAVSTQLPQLPYYIATGLLILFAVSLDVDALLGKTGVMYTAVYLAVSLGLSYWFFLQKYNPNMVLRYLVFLALQLIVLLLVMRLSTEPAALLLFSVKALPAALVLLLLLSMVVAFDIPSIVLDIATGGGTRHGLLNFSVATVVYLGNLLLLYLHNILVINWQMMYLSAFLLLLFSVIVGYLLLGRKPWYIADIQVYRLLYLGMAIIAFGYCCFAFATANDALLEAAEDAIVYSHLAIGIVYVVYIFINFLPLFRQQLHVGKVQFKPLFFPLRYFIIGAILFIVAILINNGYFPVMQGFSGYYSAQGDYARSTQNYTMAEAYYKNALAYEHQNHKANYAMASLAAQQGDNPTAGTYYRLAVQKKPSPYAYAALAQALAQEDLYFDALFALRDGLRVFPQSGQLSNNLGLQYEKAKALDSAHHYLSLAQKLSGKPQIPKANQLAIAIKHQNYRPNLAQKAETNYSYNALVANTLATNILNKQKPSLPPSQPQIPADTALNLADLAQWNNYLFLQNQAGIAATQQLSALAQNPKNQDLSQDLAWLQMQNDYAAGNKIQALSYLQSLVAADTSAQGNLQSMYNTMLLKMQTETAPSQPIKNIQTAESLFARYPMNPAIQQQTIAYLHQQKQHQKAYNLLLMAKNNLPPQASILKLYSLACLQMYMRHYATEALTELKKLNPAEHTAFSATFAAALAKYDTAHAF